MAKTVGVYSGNLVMVYNDGTAIGCTTNATLTITNNSEESTCKDDDGAVTRIPGAQEWSISVSGNSKGGAIEGVDEIGELAVTKEIITVKFGTTNADDRYYEGEAFISNFEYTGDVNTPSTWTAEYTPTSRIRMFNT